MIDLPDPNLEGPSRQRPPHNPAAREHGHRTLRRWSGVGLAGILGLTAVSAGLAYEVTSSQESARTAVVNQAKAAYQRRLDAEDANLATVRRESLVLAHTLARQHTLLAARLRARQQALAALAAAQARSQAAAASPVYASATAASGTRRTTASGSATGSRTTTGSGTPAAAVTAPKRSDDGGDTASATSGGS